LRHLRFLRNRMKHLHGKKKSVKSKKIHCAKRLIQYRRYNSQFTINIKELRTAISLRVKKLNRLKSITYLATKKIFISWKKEKIS